MPEYPTLSPVFHALADPTRRAVLEQLSLGPMPTGVLAQPHAMALPSFMQHLDLLQRGGLVTSNKQGRVRIWTLLPEPLHAATDWMTARRRLWNRRLDQLDAFLQATTPPDPEPADERNP